MSILQTVFNGLAASLRLQQETSKDHFSESLSVAQKNVNLGNMLTTWLCMLWNSNEHSDHSGEREKR
jgi:hypothetical protein